MKNIIINNKKHLRETIEKEISVHGNECDLNHLDVSKVDDMSHLFQASEFNGDISKWDVSNVTDMNRMFENSKFNQDISQWNVSNVTQMNFMFSSSEFNGFISNWNVSNVTNMNGMFFNSQFNGDVTDWRPYKLQSKEDMFKLCNAPQPYWYTDKNTQRAIELYELNEKLKKDLSSSSVNKTRIKI